MVSLNFYITSCTSRSSYTNSGKTKQCGKGCTSPPAPCWLWLYLYRLFIQTGIDTSTVESQVVPICWCLLSCPSCLEWKRSQGHQEFPLLFSECLAYSVHHLQVGINYDVFYQSGITYEQVGLDETWGGTENTGLSSWQTYGSNTTVH